MLRLLIPNYARYQHYKDRNPPWIKLHKSLLDDRKFMSLKAMDQMLLVCLWLLASENPLEEGFGVVELSDGLDELKWRLRGVEATLSEGGADSLVALKSQGFLEFKDSELRRLQPASTPLATRNTEERREEKRTNVQGGRSSSLSLTTTSPRADKPHEESEALEAKVVKPIEEQPASQAVVSIWIEVCGEGSLGTPKKRGKKTVYVGGMSPPRIVQALMPLVERHGRMEVLRNWWRYLKQRKAEFATPEDFASKYLKWARGEGGSDQSVDDHNRETLGKFVQGEKDLPSQRGLVRVLPPGDAR